MITGFQPVIDDKQIAELRVRLSATRWPSYVSRPGLSLGIGSDDAERIVDYWATQFDFGGLRHRLAAVPHEHVVIDGAAVHVVHVRSLHPHATPVIITHGWPSSFLEILPLVERLTQPERFGGRVEDACHLVIRSLPGFGYSAPPATLDGYTGAAIADLWARVMIALGYHWFFATAVAAYRDAFRKASVRQAIIEDYRAANGPDAEHDAADRAAGRRIACPVLALWAAERLVADGMESGTLTAAEVWRRWADDVRGVDIACGHLLPEQAPDAVLDALTTFLDADDTTTDGDTR